MVGLIVLQDPIMAPILHIPTITPHDHHPQRHRALMKDIGLILACILPIPHHPLKPITPQLNLLQWGGHPLHLYPKFRILAPIRRTFIMIAHTTSTIVRLLIPILSLVIHHICYILQLITTVAACHTITQRVLISKQTHFPGIRNRHRCTHCPT